MASHTHHQHHPHHPRRESKNERKLKAYYFQRRMLFGCTVSLIFAFILWIIAISSEKWYMVKGGDGIFVETSKRFFKNSQTGIWQNCRYALAPKPIPDAYAVVRNFTTIIPQQQRFAEYKHNLTRFERVQEILNKTYDDDVDEIDENFKENLFAKWMKLPEEKDKFTALKKKLKSKVEKPKYNSVKIVINSAPNCPSMTASMQNIITKKCEEHGLTMAVPYHIRDVLFDGWQQLGRDFIQLLSSYVKSLELDEGLYVNGTKIIFRPPIPSRSDKENKKNGFEYVQQVICTKLSLFAESADKLVRENPGIDHDMLDYSHTAATFAVVSVFVMILGFVFSVYTFLNPRYMYKRLAGGVHFISGLSCAIVCHVILLSVYHQKEELFYAFPKEADYTKGYAFYFGCFTAATHFFAFITFMWYSKKKKGSKAVNEELGMADEEIQIGR